MYSLRSEPACGNSTPGVSKRHDRKGWPETETQQYRAQANGISFASEYARVPVCLLGGFS